MFLSQYHSIFSSDIWLIKVVKTRWDALQFATIYSLKLNLFLRLLL